MQIFFDFKYVSASKQVYDIMTGFECENYLQHYAANTNASLYDDLQDTIKWALRPTEEACQLLLHTKSQLRPSLNVILLSAITVSMANVNKENLQF